MLKVPGYNLFSLSADNFKKRGNNNEFTSKKNIGPSMLPALSLNGLIGLVPGMDNLNKNFNCVLSIHQKVSPIIYFRIKNKEFFPLEKIPSNVSRILESILIHRF